MQAVIPIMRAQGGGMILNVSSASTKIPMYIPGIGAYNSTKYALNALTFTVRAELAADNIRVGIVYPGMMATNFAANALGVMPDWSHGSAESSPGLPVHMPALLTPEAVAAKILDAVKQELAEQYVDQAWPDTGITGSAASQPGGAAAG
ncbi:MAG: hypothetical protein DLM69_00595, partial [Candidatus Chloroheliales bacterium]